MAFTLLVNGIQYGVDVEPKTPLLWVLRDSTVRGRGDKSDICFIGMLKSFADDGFWGGGLCA